MNSDQINIRLNKFIAQSGLCSRRKADEYIQQGLISVNGETTTNLGVKVQLHDEVRFKGKVLKRENHVYVLLNKPKDYITTTDDPQKRKTVMDLINIDSDERIFPVGRLDRQTTGLLLLTNDGDLAKKLTHPSGNVPKIYAVTLDKDLDEDSFKKIKNGVTLENEKILIDDLNYFSEDDKASVGIQLHSGQNRVVRRIFESFGFKVKKLDRVSIAHLNKKNLPRGSWRFLKENEVRMLQRIVNSKPSTLS